MADSLKTRVGRVIAGGMAPIRRPVTYSVLSSRLRMSPLPPTVPNRPLTTPCGFA